MVDWNRLLGRPLVVGLCVYEVVAVATNGQHIPMLSTILKANRHKLSVMGVALGLDAWLQYHLWVED